MPAVTASITAQNTFTSALEIPGARAVFNASISGVFVATVTVQRSFGRVDITAVADGGGGEIDVTTSEDHFLSVGDVVEIAGTDDYNGNFAVAGVASSTVFSVTDTFVSSQTGTARAWRDVKVYTSEAQQNGDHAEQGVQWRVGVKTGDYTSGTVVVRLST